MAMVDRCVCHNLPFAELKETAVRCGADIDALSRETGCGASCGMCRPYLEKMLATGQTEFEVIRRSTRLGLTILGRGTAGGLQGG